MQIFNSDKRYGIVAILFHWVMALIVIGMLCVGLYMTDLKPGPEKFKFYDWHKEFGLLVLFLVIVRVTWRLINITPLLPSSVASWERIAAHIMHWLLYLLMFAMPITGWFMTSAKGFPPSFFGLFVMPPLMAPNPEWGHILATTHQWLAFTLIALLCGHIAAALQHHFIEKDNVLRRML